MNILVVTQYYYPEPFRITDICEELVRRGHTVQVMTSVPNIPEGEFYDGYGWFKHGEKERSGVSIERVDVIKRGRDKPVRLALNCASYAFNALFHLPKLGRRKFDVVFNFNNSPVSSIYPAKVFAKRHHIPYVVFILDIWPDSMYLLLNMPIQAKQTLFRRISFLVSRAMYKDASALLISSPQMEPKLRAMNLNNAVEYFPNYAEPDISRSVQPVSRGQLGLEENDVVIGFAGNVGKAQGLEKVVAAAAKLKDNKNLKFLIVGDGSERINLEKLADELGVSDMFVFVGWVDGSKVAGYIAPCDIMLACLRDNEVLNLVLPAKIQSYMAASKPMIAFMNGEGAKTVTEAKCGFTASAEDEASLCQAIRTAVATDRTELAKMGENGRQYCEKHFDREKIISDLEKYLQDACERYARENERK